MRLRPNRATLQRLQGTIAMRMTALIALSLFACAAAAETPVQPTRDYTDHFIAITINQYQKVCSARFADTAEKWSDDVERWKKRNAKALGKLDGSATMLQAFGRNRAFDPNSTETAEEREKLLITHHSLKMLAASLPGYQLGSMTDDKARRCCDEQLAALAPGGPLDQGMQQRVEAAQRLTADVAAAIVSKR
ncbi:MAG TPA: hypothetical protein VGQ91_18310 [Ideonella sp.]|nr:hypothetical protein [Ideonella sp.]